MFIIKDYKEYSEIYSSIEIEIIPAKDQYSNFINIDKENEIYYHIYFNTDKVETKNNYITKNDAVNKIKIIIDFKIKSVHGLFRNCKNIEAINFIKFNIRDINNISGMFSGCSSLKQIIFSNFNTENIITMSFMFQNCVSLEKIDLYNFNTNKVKDIDYMFE